MNTNQIASTNELSLSATGNNQKNSENGNGRNNESGQNKSAEIQEHPYSNSHQCAGGICSTTWKPLPRTA
jgi:hypothetical protein